MSLNERVGDAMDATADRFGNLFMAALFVFCGLALAFVVIGCIGLVLFPSHDDRTCVHRTPMLVGKVTTYVCDEWGTASPTDPRP